jgi:hypothetical protein
LEVPGVHDDVEINAVVGLGGVAEVKFDNGRSVALAQSNSLWN